MKRAGGNRAIWSYEEVYMCKSQSAPLETGRTSIELESKEITRRYWSLGRYLSLMLFGLVDGRDFDLVH